MFTHQTMLNNNQIQTMLILRNREGTVFSVLPPELIFKIIDDNDNQNNPNSDINIALGLAASGLEEDIANIVEMIKANPHLLLEAGNVITRGGVKVQRITLYEFFLAEGDFSSARRIEFGFAEIEGGEEDRIKQYERYDSYFLKLKEQFETNQSAYDLRPLIDIIKQSSQEDIDAALAMNMEHESVLRDALIAFRNAVKPANNPEGMHYKQYSTLIQAVKLLIAEWDELSNNFSNTSKCDLVWRQIIGYLQRSLPAVDRFSFARAFTDDERSLDFVYKKLNNTQPQLSFPDASCNDEELSGVGFDVAIYGCSHPQNFERLTVMLQSLKNTWKIKISELEECRYITRIIEVPGM